MARGEIALLHCAASYAYGEEGQAPAVPSNAVVVFEVEMLDFRGKLCYVCSCSVNNNNNVDKARLLAVSSPRAGDWLHAPPITAVGLRVSDEAVRVAVAQRLGCKACVPHTCVCGKPVDARGLHGLSCRRSAPRQQCHSQLNDIIWRALKRAQIPAWSEMTTKDQMGPRCWYGLEVSPWPGT